MSSSSSTEALRLGPGIEVAGFRLEREIGRGDEAVVWEATQVALGRRVALKLLPAEEELNAFLRWPEHPRVVRLYAAGSWEHGRFAALQLVRGPCMKQLLDAGELDPDLAHDLLADVASALDAAHREGIVHGRVTTGNVLVGDDGRALLSDFGLAGAGATIADDRAAFTALVRECLGGPRLADPRSSSASDLVTLAREEVPAPPRPRRRGRMVVAAVLCGLAAVPLAITLGAADGPDGPPPVERGALELGSTLAAGGSSSVDCSGRPPSGGSQACTLVQSGLPGRRVVVPGAGVIRRWVVRGARGEVALQVIRRRGDRYASAARSRFERIPDEGVHAMRANLAVRAGDRLGVELAPGATIGVRRGRPGVTTARWIGPLFLEPRRIELGEGTGLDREILLRVDYTAGTESGSPGQLRGRAARRAPDGRKLLSRTVEVGGGLRQVTVVRLRDEIAVDLFAGDRRLVRAPAPDVDPSGRPLSLTASYATPTLRWRNPDGRTVRREYSVGPRKLAPRG